MDKGFKKIESVNVSNDILQQCAHVLIRAMAETNAKTFKITVTHFELFGKDYGNYKITIKRESNG